LGRALNDDLQVAREASVRAVRIAGQLGVDQRAPHHSGDAIDQRMMNHTVRDVHDSMRPELEEPELGRAQVAADGEPCPLPKAGTFSGNNRDLRQALGAPELAQRVPRGRRNSRLPEAWTTRARWAVRAVARLAARPEIWGFDPTRRCAHGVWLA
jgi:hypothetical protein